MKLLLYYQYFNIYLLLPFPREKSLKLVLPIKGTLKASYIYNWIYGVSLDTTSIAFTVSISCYGRLAPVIALDTSGFEITHAMANWAWLHPKEWAIF